MVFRFSKLQDAAYEALLDLERNWACPLSIESEKGVVWRHGGDSEASYQRLQKFSINA